MPPTSPVPAGGSAGQPHWRTHGRPACSLQRQVPQRRLAGSLVPGWPRLTPLPGAEHRTGHRLEARRLTWRNCSIAHGDIHLNNNLRCGGRPPRLRRSSTDAFIGDPPLTWATLGVLADPPELLGLRIPGPNWAGWRHAPNCWRPTGRPMGTERLSGKFYAGLSEAWRHREGTWRGIWLAATRGRGVAACLGGWMECSAARSCCR